jgi:hypothetical protein
MIRQMMFVDGESLTIRAQELAKQHNGKAGDLHHPDVCCWSHWVDEHLGPKGHYIRRHYYTSITGDQQKIDAVRKSLAQQEFTPVVVKKKKVQRAKGSG